MIPRLMTEGYAGCADHDGERWKVDWGKSFCVKNAATGGAVMDETIFEAASLIKRGFAYAVMKLVEAGRLDLDRSLQSYLSKLYLKDDDPGNKTKARMVLDQTAGFQNEWCPGRPLKIKFDGPANARVARLFR